jgi:hypothetical protein
LKIKREIPTGKMSIQLQQRNKKQACTAFKKELEVSPQTLPWDRCIPTNDCHVETFHTLCLFEVTPRVRPADPKRRASSSEKTAERLKREPSMHQ